MTLIRLLGLGEETQARRLDATMERLYMGVAWFVELYVKEERTWS